MLLVGLMGQATHLAVPHVAAWPIELASPCLHFFAAFHALA